MTCWLIIQMLRWLRCEHFLLQLSQKCESLLPYAIYRYHSSSFWPDQGESRNEKEVASVIRNTVASSKYCSVSTLFKILSTVASKTLLLKLSAQLDKKRFGNQWQQATKSLISQVERRHRRCLLTNLQEDQNISDIVAYAVLNSGERGANGSDKSVKQVTLLFQAYLPNG